MSPEQQSGEEVDERTDVYSLAVTMYEALAGKALPYGQYQALSFTDETIPPEIDVLVQACLETKERRLATVREFGDRLARALRPHRPLSDVLASGRLHEIALALEPISPQEFVDLPEGQKPLVIIKIVDITESGDPNLDFPAEHFLVLLLIRGLLLSEDQYRQIVRPSVEWGYKRSVGVFVGNPKVRQALVSAASQANTQAHKVISGEFKDFLGTIKLESTDEWFLNSARDLLQTLLANPACQDDAADLGRALQDVNAIQHSRQSGDTVRVAEADSSGRV